MTCNRDKNSMKGKGVHSGIPLHVGFGGGNLEMTCNRDKNSLKGKDVHSGIPLHVGLCGGKFKKGLAIVTRTL